jgi:hypothetical protein
MRTVRGRLLMGTAIFLALSAILSADEWPLPLIREVFSEARGHFVRVTPGNSWGDTMGFAGSPKGEFTKAEFYHRRQDGAYVPGASVTTVNPVAPVEFYVSDAGYLATMDNWHNMGYGKVFALYAPDGALVKSYELSDLFSKEEIERFDHSASSIWWHRGATYIQKGQKMLYVMIDEKGGGMSFDLETGAYQYCEWHPMEFLCRTSSGDRKWEPYKNPE